MSGLEGPVSVRAAQRPLAAGGRKYCVPEAEQGEAEMAHTKKVLDL